MPFLSPLSSSVMLRHLIFDMDSRHQMSDSFTSFSENHDNSSVLSAHPWDRFIYDGDYWVYERALKA